MKRNRWQITIIFLSFFMLANMAFAADNPTNEELYEMIQELKAEKKEDADKTSESASLSSEFEDSYLKFKSADGNFEYKLDGRIMLDTGAVQNSNEDNDLYTNTEFRRLRLALKTTMYGKWKGEFDLDFAEKEVDLKDLWVSYIGFPNTEIKAGNQKPHFSLNEVTSSRNAVFMETSMVTDSFSTGRRIGISASNWGKHYFAGASLFGDEVAVNPSDENQSEGHGYSARLVGRPYVSDDCATVLHFGLNYLRHEPMSDEPDDEFRYNSRSEAHFVDYKFLKHDKIENTKDVQTYGLELTAKLGKAQFQTEYMKSKINSTDSGKSPEFDGWYAYVSYFLTDDQRLYNLSDAEFGGVRPKGKYGAFEVALRYSTLNLNDQSVWADDLDDNGGEAKNITAALNWYINNNLMLKINYIHVDNDEFANGNGDFEGDDDLDIIGTRLQFVF
ncbi:MAG: hypothetical protein GY874_12615 [Desulfobacteraceae bacterium]|nr:hypothetical protein [Desulfobacteraceae bacterium]